MKRKIILRIFASVLLGALLLSFAGCGKAEYPDDTAYIDSSNIFSRGYSAAYGSTAITNALNQTGVFKQNSDGAITSKLFNVSASFINVTDDYIYCIDQKSSRLVRCDKKGNNLSVVSDSSICQYLNVTKTDLFYYDVIGNCVNRIHISDISANSKRTPYQTVLKRELSQLYVYKGYLYFLDAKNSSYLTRIAISSLEDVTNGTVAYEDAAEVVVPERLAQYVLYNGKIYFRHSLITISDTDTDASEEGIFCVDMDGFGNRTTVTTESAAAFAISKDVIYFVRPNYNSYASLFTVSIANGTVGTPVEEGVDNPTNFCVAGDFIIMNCAGVYQAVKNSGGKLKRYPVE